MKKRLAVAAAALMFAGLGAGVVGAAPGPNESNHHGLCTAYFNGNKTGHGKNDGESPGPFAALEDGRELSAIFDDCNGDPKGIDGNPEENGRFTTCFVDDDADESTHPCDDNPA
jgi:hypothetical protein